MSTREGRQPREERTRPRHKFSRPAPLEKPIATDISSGRESEIVARCQDIHAAATANVDVLGEYGVNPAKLTALKKKIEGFDAIQSKPRAKIASSSAATKSLPVLFEQADEILNERLDKLAVQFKESEPAFYNAHVAARVTVDISGGRASENAAKMKATDTPAPADGTTPLPKVV